MRTLCLTSILLLGLALGSGCSRNSIPAVDTSDPAQYSQLPEAPSVLAALKEKKYDEVVASVAKLKETVSTETQNSQYYLLVREVKNQLADAAPTDPKAAEALEMFRLMSTGR